MLEPIPFAGYMEIEEMNANELADELIKINEYYNLEEEEMEQAAAMLRQQQAKIEELIKHLEFAGIVVERNEK